MNESLNELNKAIANLSNAVAPNEYRFYYDPVTRHGTKMGGTDDNEPYVLLTCDEYEKIGMAFTHYVSKSGKVKPIPVAMGPGLLLELTVDGNYRTIKDCMIFADPAGPDSYKLKGPDYE